jgi:hypothetical protein
MASKFKQMQTMQALNITLLRPPSEQIQLLKQNTKTNIGKRRDQECSRKKLFTSK